MITITIVVLILIIRRVDGIYYITHQIAGTYNDMSPRIYFIINFL